MFSVFDLMPKISVVAASPDRRVQLAVFKDTAVWDVRRRSEDFSEKGFSQERRAFFFVVFLWRVFYFRRFARFFRRFAIKRRRRFAERLFSARSVCLSFEKIRRARKARRRTRPLRPRRFSFVSFAPIFPFLASRRFRLGTRGKFKRDRRKANSHNSPLF